MTKASRLATGLVYWAASVVGVSAARADAPQPKVVVVEDGESKVGPEQCRGVVVGPGVNQPDPFPGYAGFVGWESPIRLASGDWIVGFSAGYWHASPATPLPYKPENLKAYIEMGLPADIEAPTGGRAMFVRSTDEGKTWGKPETLIDTPADDRHPAFVQLADGTIICTFFDYDGDERDARVFTVRSLDDGKTWEQKPHLLNELGFYETDGPLVLVKDGSIIVALNGRPNGPPDKAGIFRSTDGVKWEHLSTVQADYDLQEVSVTELTDGRWVLIARPEGAISWSSDQGKTWTPPATFGIRMFAPSLTVLRDGTLLCLHGSYAPGFAGLRAIFSTDGGATWIAPAKDHGFLVDNSYGYGKPMELEDGTLFVSYISSGGHRGNDAASNAVWCIRMRVRADHAGIDLLPAPNR